MHITNTHDTLCGTKVMWREDYKKIAANRSYFGDFDLIFGAAKLNRKIIDSPSVIVTAPTAQPTSRVGDMVS